MCCVLYDVLCWVYSSIVFPHKCLFRGGGGGGLCCVLFSFVFGSSSCEVVLRTEAMYCDKHCEGAYEAYEYIVVNKSVGHDHLF